jgi:hypothetical protein
MEKVQFHFHSSLTCLSLCKVLLLLLMPW